ncbi:hypothetical protein GWK47_008430 [Chionoecetes opilio]|uniref:Uncharacterized protein n=1 Tax=Chionoecetes opilio TaxID=41210 RepID=A0A8J4XZA0_CHIOP|nr:hypothetical protein GWK47_008430 [Chionoecetes opilio]
MQGQTSKNRRFYLLINYLDGSEDAIRGNKHPSSGQVLSVFLHKHLNLKMERADSAKVVVREVLVFWDKARIPTQRQDKILAKVQALYDCWKGLKKNQGRQTQMQRTNEERFKTDMGNLFDVASADVLKLIKNPEDRDFLLAKRELGRRGSLGSVDLELVRKEEAAQKKKEAYARQIERTQMEQEASCSLVELASSFSVSFDSEGSVVEEKGAVGDDAGPPKRKRSQVHNVWTPGLTAALERTKMSDRMAPYVLTEVAKSLGHDPVELNMSRSSVKRYRERYRAENGETQLLGVSKLDSGTGDQQANTVYTLLQEWDLEDKVVGMSFDTTAANIGRHSGACVLLERKLSRGMLYFACRHHILEVIMGAVFRACAGPSSGPDIQVFRRFQRQWNLLDKKEFRTGWDSAETPIHRGGKGGTPGLRLFRTVHQVTQG